MANIVIWMFPELGHFYGSIGLVRRLVSAGHHVKYVTLAPLEHVVADAGLEPVVVLRDLFPRTETIGSTPLVRGPLAQLRAARHLQRRMTLGLERLERGELDYVFKRTACDLLLADTLLPVIALRARRLGIRSGLLSTLFPRERTPGIPPITSSLLPAATFTGRLNVWRAWTWRRVKANTAALTLGALGLTRVDIRAIKRMAPAAGVRLRAMDLVAPFAPAVALPELVTCPRELDFPCVDRPHRRYLEPCIEVERSTVDFDWSWLQRDKQLIYLSLGTQAHRYPRLVRPIRHLFQTIASRTHVQLVASVGVHAQELQKTAVPRNVKVIGKAPQTALLERASLFITHAGLASVKEAIYFGVPMLAMPLVNDQPGNAARILFHGLGDIISPSELSHSDFGIRLDRLMADHPCRTKVAQMREVFREQERKAPSGKIIERWLAERELPPLS